MAWIEQHRRSDERLSAGRDLASAAAEARYGSARYSASEATPRTSLAPKAPSRWSTPQASTGPLTGVKGMGFVRPVVEAPTAPPASAMFAGVAEECVRQIVDLSPVQRTCFLGQIRTRSPRRTPSV
ncbi:hypothetical protein [Nocardioides ultimimeridianus]